MTVNDNGKGGPNYFPNSFNGPQPLSDPNHHLDTVSGNVERVDTGDEDNFSQCRNFFRNVLNGDERDRLTSNIANHMVNASESIRTKATANFAAVDPVYGKTIHDKIKVLLKEKKDVSPMKRVGKPVKLSPPREIPGKCPYGFSSKL